MKINNIHYKTIWFNESDKTVGIIDQTKLPHELIIQKLSNVEDMISAIKDMRVRGAPLIGAAAAFAMFLASKENNSIDFIKKSSEKIKHARPTAINLEWAVDRSLNKIKDLEKSQFSEVLLREAEEICNEDIGFCKKIGLFGYELIRNIYDKVKRPVNILTHCNAGWLATIDWGTATAPIYQSHYNNIPIHVWVDETRPRNQGANLTSYELNHENISNTIIADNTGGILMQRGQVDLCIVGSDRTLFTGDVCNKVGTYLKAIAAYENKVPFYVALPSSTIDWNTKNYNQIPIEERSGEELSVVSGLNKNNEVENIYIYPKESKSLNIAFDITPAKYVTGLITEKGICKASEESIINLYNK